MKTYLDEITAPAEMGLEFCAQQRALTRNARLSRANNVNTGWTNPSVSYDKLRQIEAAAIALDHQIQQYVVSADFRHAWNVWYDNFRAYYEKYAGPNASTSAKLAAAFASDEIAVQVESFRTQLENFTRQYSAQRQPNGQSVPEPIVQAPGRLTIDELKSKERGFSPKLELPWWAWTIGGVAVVGVGYYAYRKIADIWNLPSNIAKSASRDPASAATSKSPFELATYARRASLHR